MQGTRMIRASLCARFKPMATEKDNMKEKERIELYAAIAALFGPKAAADAYLIITWLAIITWFIAMFVMD